MILTEKQKELIIEKVLSSYTETIEAEDDLSAGLSAMKTAVDLFSDIVTIIEDKNLNQGTSNVI